MTISHLERMKACIKGEKTDRAPVALWRHFPVDDQSASSLAAATLNFQDTYDFDLIKVTPASSFCVRDWGMQDSWEGNPEGTRRYTNRVIQKPQDWEKLALLDSKAPHMARQLECLHQIRSGLGKQVPILQTVFNPLAQAKNLVGRERLIAHMRKYPEAVIKGLETITKTTQRFIEAAVKTGIDGIFYAIQHAQAGLLTLEEYKSFGTPFDLLTLQPASQLWCSILHLHGNDIYFEVVKDYTFPVVNWHDRENWPSLGEAQKEFSGVVCGGVKQDTLVLQTPSDVRAEAEDAIEQTKAQRLILSTGCVVPIMASHGNLMAVRNSVASSSR